MNKVPLAALNGYMFFIYSFKQNVFSDFSDTKLTTKIIELNKTDCCGEGNFSLTLLPVLLTCVIIGKLAQDRLKEKIKTTTFNSYTHKVSYKWGTKRPKQADSKLL